MHNKFSYLSEDICCRCFKFSPDATMVCFIEFLFVVVFCWFVCFTGWFSGGFGTFLSLSCGGPSLNTWIAHLLFFFFKSKAPNVYLRHCEHGQRLNCWVLLGIMKGHAILVDGKLHLSVSAKLSFRATLFHYKMIFQSAAWELQKIGIYAEMLAFWGNREGCWWPCSLLYEALLIFCSSLIPYPLTLPRPWCPWEQSPTSLIFQRWGRDHLEEG